MGSLGIINTDPVLRDSLEAAFQDSNALKGDTDQGEYDLKFFTEEEDILNFLRYDFPEIVVINFSDPRINIDNIISRIEDDISLFKFGVVGLYQNEKDTEDQILGKYKTANILAILDNYRVRSHVLKTVRIIEQNYQIIFQREFNQSLLNEVSGSFIIDNDLMAIPVYAGMGAMLLSQRGLIAPEKRMSIQLALSELIVNAVEHGNCGITYDEKTIAMDKGLSMVDLVAQKCADPAIGMKKVEFLWDIGKDATSFVIRDQGKGFDVRAHLKKIATQDVMSLHGRGIKMASMYAAELKYNDTGNQVTMTVHHDADVERDVPVGFSRGRILAVKQGDIVLREDEPSDYLYYIVSGSYSVYHNLKKVGSLSPQDIFMGEMSFLLNQRRSASVRADGPGKLIFLTRRNFVGIIHSYPHYGIFLSKLLAKRLVRSNDRNAELLVKISDS
jgi:anti-sigma regulatory factor (Ser/Thr protein kinase)